MSRITQAHTSLAFSIAPAITAPLRARVQRQNRELRIAFFREIAHTLFEGQLAEQAAQGVTSFPLIVKNNQGEPFVFDIQFNAAGKKALQAMQSVALVYVIRTHMPTTERETPAGDFLMCCDAPRQLEHQALRVLKQAMAAKDITVHPQGRIGEAAEKHNEPSRRGILDALLFHSVMAATDVQHYLPMSELAGETQSLSAHQSMKNTAEVFTEQAIKASEGRILHHLKRFYQGKPVPETQ